MALSNGLSVARPPAVIVKPCSIVDQMAIPVVIPMYGQYGGRMPCYCERGRSTHKGSRAVATLADKGTEQ